MASRALLGELVYRDFRDADDEGCKALEMRAMQGSRFPWLQSFTRIFLRGGFEHFVTFDAKPKQYEDWVIRVAEDGSSGGRIIGVGCAAIKTARVRSKMCKVAYVFDLRVDEDYQGFGVGKALTEQIEEACAAKGAHFLYLTVNSDNTKAKSLYSKRGFVVASQRHPALVLLAFPEPEDGEVLVEQLPKDKADKLTKSFYSAADLLLDDLGQLFNSPLYEGTFVARRGDSVAGVSAWNGSYLTGFKIERFLVPVGWWKSPWLQLLILLAGAWGGWKWATAMQAAGMSALQTHRAAQIAAFLAMFAITAVGTCCLWKAWPVLSFMGSKITSNDSKMRHRLFGPFAFGPKEDQEELLRVVQSRVHNLAREAGYAMSICNIDANHPLRPFFSSNRFTTTFMYKSVSGAADLPPFTPDNFFDPRDL